MNKKEIAPNVDFADSTYRSCEMDEEKLIIYLNSWENKILRIQFSYPIQFFYKIGSIVSNVYEILYPSTFLDEALLKYYKNVPREHPFKFFIIEDIEDCAFIEVVAQDVNIFKE